MLTCPILTALWLYALLGDPTWEIDDDLARFAAEEATARA